MINYLTVKNDFETENWELISTAYKNLDTELECKCPDGHIIFITYKDWRKNKSCPECLKGDTFKIKKRKIPPKQEGVFRILALDAATITSGYALYDDKNLIGYGHFTIKGDNTTARINEVKQWLTAAIEEWRPDSVCLEHIQLQSFNSNGKYTKGENLQVELYRVLANLQGVLLDFLYEIGIPSALVYSAVWRKFCDVTGKSREDKKKDAQRKVVRWFDLEVTQDEADAICLGKYFSNNYRSLDIQIEKWGEDI